METNYIILFILIKIYTIQSAYSFDQSPKTSIIGNSKEFGDRLFDLKNRNKFCDADAVKIVDIVVDEIVVGNERIAIHKIILASSSPVFKTIFSNSQSVVMENIDFEIFQSLIEYCNTGIISVSERNFRGMMLLGSFLKITPIFEGCVKILEKKIDSLNCIWSWRLAKSEKHENLRNIALDYIRQNYEKVSQSLEFLYLDDSEILELLDSFIAVKSETIILNSVKTWINHNSSSRKQYLEKFSNFIKSEYLPKNENKNNLQLEFGEKSIKHFYSTLTVIGYNWSDKPKKMEIFDLRSEQWTKIEKFSFDKVAFSAVFLENKLMLIGGLDKKHQVVDTVESYDLSTGTMENLPPMITNRNRLTAVEFKGRIYAIGGYNGYRYLNSMEMWDPMLEIWKNRSPMTFEREDCEAVVLGEEIFVVGGYRKNDTSSENESYNPITNKWTIRASMSEKRKAPGVAVIDGYLYVVGGMSKNNIVLNTAERYDYKTNKWTTIHPLRIAKYVMGAGSLYGKFVVVGGSSDENQKLSIMEMYDEEKDKWISMPSLNEPRYDFRAINIPWRLAKAVLSREVPK